MDEILQLLKTFDLKQFLKKKLMLLVALVCAILSLLIDKGILHWDAQYEGRLLVAAVVLMLIWLVMDGLQKKYKKMVAVYEATMAQTASEEDPADSGEN